MSKVDKYPIGTIFENTTFPDEAYCISDIIVIGKTDKSKTRAYQMIHIPDKVSHVMPTGRIWINEKKPFISSDEVIDSELFHKTWKKL